MGRKWGEGSKVKGREGRRKEVMGRRGGKGSKEEEGEGRGKEGKKGWVGEERM